MAGDVCDVCGVEGREVVGVASVDGVPLSVAWCRPCLNEPLAVPPYVADHWLEDCGDLEDEDPLTGLAEWVHEASIWQPHADPKGRYQPIRDYAQAKQ